MSAEQLLPEGWEAWPDAAKLKLRDELKALRVQADVFGALGYEPTARQQAFHAATEYDVLYGGAAGGGKTRALLMDDIRDALTYPGIRIGAFRRTYGELDESLLAELAQISYAVEVGARWNSAKHELSFPNGSLIMYRYAESVQDATRRQGGQYQKLTFDELTLTPPDVVAFLKSRIRSGRRDIPVLGVRSGSNPGGVGHGDVKKRYIDATDYGQNVIVDKRKRTVRFIPSKLHDNPHLNPEYIDDLNELPEEMRRAFVEGNWDVFAGQFFAEFDRDLHAVDPFPIPPEWKRYAGIDYGYAAPYCTLWGAADRDGRIWVYRELYEKGVVEADQAAQIKAAEAGDTATSRRFADPAMWAKTGSAPSPAQAYEAGGVSIEKAVNDRAPGWSRLRGYLAPGPACGLHREQGYEECPKLHITTACLNLLRTLPTMPFDRKQPEDLDTHAEDHAVDSLRYLIMGASGASRPAKVSVAVGQIPGVGNRSRMSSPSRIRMGRR
jgi:hypothetical protein